MTTSYYQGYNIYCKGVISCVITSNGPYHNISVVNPESKCISINVDGLHFFSVPARQNVQFNVPFGIDKFVSKFAEGFLPNTEATKVLYG